MAKNFDASKKAYDYMMEQGRNDNFLGSMWGALRTAGTGLYDVAGNLLWRSNKEDTNKSTPSEGMGSRGGGFRGTTDISLNDILDEYNSSSSSSSGGGPGMIDISNILAAYEQEAASNRNVAKSKYDNTRNDLLTSLKRYQEQNAQDVANQQRAYLSNQAALESAIAQADRQNRISAAARGIGGSGLQQLAQLQNLLSQGQNISDLATSNQQAMDNLRLALARQSEDTDTKVARALTDYTNALSTINSTLASNKANIEYQARENAAARAASARSSSEERMTANEKSAKAASQEIASIQEALRNTLRDINSMKKSDLKNNYNTKDKNVAKQKAYDEAVSTARNLMATYNIGVDSNTSQVFLNNLLSLYENS